MKVVLLGALLAVVVASSSHAACFRASGCPAGRKNGDKWEENCQKCSCTGQIEESKTLCYLPSDKPSQKINLHIVNYDSTKVEAKVQQTGCPRGFVKVEEADMYNVMTELILAFAPKPTGGSYGCCDKYGYPVGVHKSCKALKTGCQWKVVSKNNEDLPCPHPHSMVGK